MSSGPVKDLFTMDNRFDSDTLAQRGFTVARGLIGPEECRALAALWPDKARFRSHVIMQRHGYGPGEYQYFPYPLQVTILLSEPGRDFEGGEFMLVEQWPRMQSRGEVVPLGRGDAVVFAVNERAAKGTRGYHRTAMRHGVSSLRTGERFTLGII